MSKFVLMTDDTCDFPAEYYAENDIAVASFAYSLDGEIYRAADRSEKEFYDLVRAGKKPTTIALNAAEIKAVMEPHLADGKDVLYIAFSSGLSITVQNAGMAVAELREKYPDRKVILVDSLCASMGEGLLVRYVNEIRRGGAEIEQAAAWATENRLKIAHIFMPDDLMHLHRGGRLPITTAIAGKMLGIKPILRVNEEGKLEKMDKARGKRQAMTVLVETVARLAGNSMPDFFHISHADCLEDAEQLAKLARAHFGIDDCIISCIGPVIGTHTGAGTLALFMMAENGR